MAYISIDAWKQQCNILVNSKDILGWKIACTMYSSLQLYDFLSLESTRISPWWTYVSYNPEDTKKCQTLFKLMFNTYRLGKTMCEFCSNHNRNSVLYILFECKSIATVRKKYWNYVAHAGLPNLVDALDRMDAREKCKFIFNGFCVNFVLEWNSFYRYILRYVVKVYTGYHNALKENC